MEAGNSTVADGATGITYSSITDRTKEKREPGCLEKKEI